MKFINEIEPGIYEALVEKPSELKPRHMDVRKELFFKDIPSLVVVELYPDLSIKHLRGLWNESVRYIPDSHFEDEVAKYQNFTEGEVLKIKGGYEPVLFKNVITPLFKMSGTTWRVGPEVIPDLQEEIEKEIKRNKS